MGRTEVTRSQQQSNNTFKLTVRPVTARAFARSAPGIPAA
jgi:hypothetical protein